MIHIEKSVGIVRLCFCLVYFDACDCAYAAKINHHLKFETNSILFIVHFICSITFMHFKNVFVHSFFALNCNIQFGWVSSLADWFVCFWEFHHDSIIVGSSNGGNNHFSDQKLHMVTLLNSTKNTQRKAIFEMKQPNNRYNKHKINIWNHRWACIAHTIHSKIGCGRVSYTRRQHRHQTMHILVFTTSVLLPIFTVH